MSSSLPDQAKGEAHPSFLLNELEKMKREGGKYPNTIEDIKGAAGTMSFGGSDTVSLFDARASGCFRLTHSTTWATLSIFFLAMVLYPECQARAQEEIDAVIGNGRLPELSDRASLPYVESILQETLR